MREYFAKFGEVEEAKLVKGDEGKHKGSGFVKMKNVEDADKIENISKAFWNEKL